MTPQPALHPPLELPGTKRPFDFPTALRRIRAAVRHLPKAALFELAEDGFDTPFEQLVACIISVRTRDEVTLEVARELFAKARTPRDIARMSVRDIDAAIRRSTFHFSKARWIRRIAEHAG